MHWFLPLHLLFSFRSNTSINREFTTSLGSKFCLWTELNVIKVFWQKYKSTHNFLIIFLTLTLDLTLSVPVVVERNGPKPEMEYHVDVLWDVRVHYDNDGLWGCRIQTRSILRKINASKIMNTLRMEKLSSVSYCSPDLDS